MIGFADYAKQLILGTLILWLVVGYPMYAWGNSDIVIASLVSCVICAVNALVGGAIALWAKGKDQATFLKAVFGGMGIRIFIVLILFFSVVKLAKLNVFSLTLSLFLFYVLFQILEIHFFVKKSSNDPAQTQEQR